MKLKKSALIATGALLSMALFLGGCGESKPNFGYFNGDRVVKESAQIEAVINESKKKMEELQQEAMKLADESNGMSEEDIRKKQLEFQNRAQAINISAGNQIQQKVQNALAEISKAKKLDVVMENEKGQKNVVLGGVDVTDDLIEKLK